MDLVTIEIGRSGDLTIQFTSNGFKLKGGVIYLSHAIHQYTVYNYVYTVFRKLLRVRLHLKTCGRNTEVTNDFSSGETVLDEEMDPKT